MATRIAGGLALEDLWREVGFSPNRAQEAAIRHVEGPLYLPAGPGSGKMKVKCCLLRHKESVQWRKQ